MKKNTSIIIIGSLLVISAVIYGGFFANPGQLKPLVSTKVPNLAGGPEREERGFPQREILDLASMFPDLVFNSGPTAEKKVALTFDDGPDDVFTAQILDVLKQKQVPATFFVIGNRAEVFPDIMKRIVNEGHTVGNHTWNHPNVIKLTQEKVAAEISKTNDFLKRYTDKPVKLFRSPYGSIDPDRIKIVDNLGMKVIAWNVDSLDWKGLSAAEVKTNILENAREGSIILQHSAGGPGEDLTGTVQALPKIIDVLQQDGYQFLSVTELLGSEENKN